MSEKIEEKWEDIGWWAEAEARPIDIYGNAVTCSLYRAGAVDGSFRMTIWGNGSASSYLVESLAFSSRKDAANFAIALHRLWSLAERLLPGLAEADPEEPIDPLATLRAIWRQETGSEPDEVRMVRLGDRVRLFAGVTSLMAVSFELLDDLPNAEKVGAITVVVRQWKQAVGDAELLARHRQSLTLLTCTAGCATTDPLGHREGCALYVPRIPFKVGS